MKQINKKITLIVLASFFVLGLFNLVIAANTVSLGTADSFAILAGSTITNTGPSVVIGNMGLDPGSSITGFPPATLTGTEYINNATSAQAQLDLTTAYDNAAGQGCTQDLTDQDLGGLILTPGVYCFNTSAQLTGILTLDGQNNPDAVFIFKTGSTLTTASGSSVVLINDSQACNVFWQVGSSATIGGNTTFKGNILALTSITFNTGASLQGRALARNGAVTLDTNNITKATCTILPSATAYISGPGIDYEVVAPTRIVPLIGILKIPSPLALAKGPGSVTYNYTIWNVGGLQALTNVTLIDDKCTSISILSGDVNSNNKLDPEERWKYSCTSNLSSTTTNTAIATGYSDDEYHQAAIATAIATVVVSSPLPSPLINIVKIPSRLTAFPYGGGDVTYTYTVTNPGVIAIHDIFVTDDKCAPVSYISGDNNGDKLLDTSEVWVYTCKTKVSTSTTNIATVEGKANGFTTIGHAFATVLVSAPILPQTGAVVINYNVLWGIIIAVAIILVLVVLFKKRKA
ncbi:MAG: ice-binding family protein [Minisyncoccales bacterium]